MVEAFVVSATTSGQEIDTGVPDACFSHRGLMRGTLLTLTVLPCLMLGACGVEGTTDLVPQPIDVHSSLITPGTSSALAAPAGWKPAPDLPTPRFSVPATRLFEAVQQVASAQPRTFLQASYPDRMQAFYIVHSMVMNLPDLVVVQVSPDGPSASTLVMFSHSRYDPYEAGTNLRRLERWLRQVERSVVPSHGP